jgi:hypothetical protein
MNTATLEEVLAPHGVEIPEHLEAQAEIPICTGLMRQGDVLVRPTKPGEIAGLKPIPQEGIPVVRGESGGNTHLLVGGGQWKSITTDPAVMGSLVVENTPAYLIHPEHGAQGIGPGQYTISRQREQADVERLVAD